jgi:hypothetical protein
MTEALIGAIIGAVVGGALAVLGGLWATATDLRIRNRHALLLEDLPAFYNHPPPTGTLAEVWARDSIASVHLDRVIARAMTLDRDERAAALRIREARSRLDGTTGEAVDHLAAIAEGKLAASPFRQALRVLRS